MKKYLLFIAFLGWGFVGFGQCPGVFITEQSQIDNFAANYPGCTEFEFIAIEGFNSNIINLEGLSQIETIGDYLRVEGTSIQNMVGLENLVYIGGFVEIVSNGVLENFQGLHQLNTIGNFLEISQNNSLQNLLGLESLTSVGLPEGQGVGITFNNTLVSLSGLENLAQIRGVLEIWYNGELENLNGLNGLIYLYGHLKIRSNDSIQTLSGLENLQFIEEFLFINDNENLQSIYSLNNTNFASVLFANISENDQLSFCAVDAVCQAITNPQAEILIENNSPGCNSQTEVEADCNIPFNAIQGTIVFDFDNNGCGTTDYPAGNLIVKATNVISQSVSSTITDNFGDFAFPVPEGEYTVEISPSPTNFVPDPISQQVTFTGGGNIEIVDFCLVATASINDLKITLLPLSEARPGFEAEYQLVYENIGTTPLSGEVTLQFDNVRQDFVEASPVPDNVTGNTITWNYSDLLPFQSSAIEIVMYSAEPPINNSEDILIFEAIVNPITDDTNPDDNTYVFEQIMVNSYDPNDKQVVQGDEIYEAETDNYLDYIVRFQNTGTADAINVEITDVLSDNLNWDTFRMLSSSHDYRVEITDGNQVAFIFENINLPPEITDPEGSNGHVAFQIKPIETIDIGDVVENTANIYFDFNPPIITNTVSTTVVDNLSVESFGIDHSVRVFPNPVASNLVIEVAAGINFEKASVYSLLGKRLIETSESEINMEKLSAGIYFVEVFTDKGKVSRKVIKE